MRARPFFAMVELLPAEIHAKRQQDKDSRANDSRNDIRATVHNERAALAMLIEVFATRAQVFGAVIMQSEYVNELRLAQHICLVLC